MTIQINETKGQVAKTILDAISDWQSHPQQSVTVYVDKDGITDTYTANKPSDFVADLYTVNEWAFGDRPEGLSDHDEIGDDEANALIMLFCEDWLITEATDEFGDSVDVVYKD